MLVNEMPRVDPALVHPDLPAVLQALQHRKTYCLDLETTQLKAKRGCIEGVVVAVGDTRKESWYLDCLGTGGMHPEQRDAMRDSASGGIAGAQSDRGLAILDHLEPYYTDPDYTLISHGLFELPWFWEHGKDIRCKWANSELSAFIRNENLQSHGLKGVSKAYWGVHLISYEEAKVQRLPGFGKTFTEYAQDDGRYAWKNFHSDLPVLEREGLAKMFWELDCPVSRVVAKMQFHGINIDVPFLRSQMGTLREKRLAAQRKFEAMVGADLSHGMNTPAKLAYVLYKKMGLPYKELGIKIGSKKLANEAFPDGIPSTNEESLKMLIDMGHDAPKALLDYRGAEKDLQFYEKMVHDAGTSGMVWPTFGQTATVTGRFACWDPNMQQVPRADKSDLRKCVAAPDGWTFWDSDFSQIELRLMAHCSRDPVMIQMYKEGQDIHALTAKQCGCTRQVAKIINFGLIYGLGPEGLRRHLFREADVKISLEQAQVYCAAYFDTYSHVKPYHKAIDGFLRAHKYVRTIFSNRRRADARWLQDLGKVRSAAINFTIQGAAGVLIKIAMRNLDRRFVKEGLAGLVPSHGDAAKITMQVHDELAGLARSDVAEQVAEIVKYEMAHCLPPPGLTVPIMGDVGLGPNWYEAH